MFTQPDLELLGTFEVKDGTLVVSDPCYDRGTWCAGSIENAKLGTWNAYVRFGATDWGKRPWELVILHSDYSESTADKISESTSMDVGVDSGQAGFFDDSSFKGGEDDWGDNGWYDLCCRTTLDEKLCAGVIPGGCVSSSGFGDGSYDCLILRDGVTEVIGAKIVFIAERDFS